MGLISSEARIKSHDAYWNGNSAHRDRFIVSHVKRKPVARRRPRLGSQKAPSQRINSYNCFLVDDEKVERKVCRKFFLATLGYKENNSRVISAATKRKNPVDWKSFKSCETGSLSNFKKK